MGVLLFPANVSDAGDTYYTGYLAAAKTARHYGRRRQQHVCACPASAAPIDMFRAGLFCSRKINLNRNRQLLCSVTPSCYF